MSPRQTVVDHPSERTGMHLRLLRATAKHAAFGDEDELLEMAGVVRYAGLCRDYVALSQLAQGKTYAQIGEAFGFTKQAAHKRWGHMDIEDVARALGIAA